MQVFLPLLCFLCATPVHGIFHGTCPRKDPPPGVLVLSTGSNLILRCSGHVEVDGVKVNLARNGVNPNRKASPADASPTTTVNIRSNTGDLIKSGQHTAESTVSKGHHSNPTVRNRRDTGYTASPTTTTNARLKSEFDETYGEDDYEEEDEEEEEGAEGSRVTRGIKSRPQWKWNGRTVEKGHRDGGEITVERRGASLSLSSVRPTDSGRYTCYHGGRQRFSLKITVSDPPETPSLSCYKRSPSSKIRCEWTPQKPVTILPNCYLLLSKNPTETFLRFPCSYSSRLSRCWCALDHNEDELRRLHLAYLCVTSITGNATSNLQYFIPLDILKPNPPSNVSVQQEEGQETRMRVTWSLPISWKSHDTYYELIYEIKYRPLKSLFHYEQVQMIKSQRSYTITDAMPGVEYLIQLRAKDEYDGQWSDWSTPIYASSWTAKWTVEYDDHTSTMFPVYRDKEGSADDYVSDVPEPVHGGVEVSHHVLWVFGSFAFLSVILAAYIFRHKDRFMSKLQSLSIVTRCRDSPQPVPSAPTPPEGHALMIFVRPCFKQPPPSEVEEREEENEEEEEEEQRVKEKIEAMNFSNTSYFFLHRE